MKPTNWITRTAERISLFSAATVYGGGTSRPARLRNMSAQGAMVESTLVPEVGSLVVIRRGSHRAKGRVVWTRDGGFGLSFSFPAQVNDWIVAHNPKQRIADLVSAGAEPTVDQPDPAPVGKRPNQFGLHAQVAEVVRLMTDLGDDLAEDLTVAGSYCDALQDLEAAMNILQQMPGKCAGISIARRPPLLDVPQAASAQALAALDISHE